MKWNTQRARIRWAAIQDEVRPRVRAAACHLADRAELANDLEQDGLLAVWIYLTRFGWRAPVSSCVCVAEQAMLRARARSYRWHRRIDTRSLEQVQQARERAA